MIKPTVLLILLLLVSGAIFLERFPPTIVRYRKSEGYHTFILASAVGIALFVVSFIIVALFSDSFLAKKLGASFSAFVSKLLPALAKNTDMLNVASVCFLSVFLAYIIPATLVLYSKKIKKRDPFYHAWQKDAKRSESPEFSSLFFNALELRLPIAFTLSNRKVYVGFVTEFSMFSNDVHILPLISGYRHEDTLDYVRVINYQKVMNIFKNSAREQSDSEEFMELISKKFGIAIPYREIVHANIHDISHYNDFAEHRYDSKNTEPNEIHYEYTTVQTPKPEQAQY